MNGRKKEGKTGEKGRRKSIWKKRRKNAREEGIKKEEKTKETKNKDINK